MRLLLLLLLTGTAAHAQAVTPYRDSLFTLPLPADARPIPGDPMALGPRTRAFALALGASAVLSVRPLETVRRADFDGWADSVRLSRVPTDLDARAAVLGQRPKHERYAAGPALRWAAFCNDCEVDELVIHGPRTSLMITLAMADVRPSATRRARAQLQQALRGLTWVK